MKKIKTILTPEELKFLKNEKRLIIRGYNACRKQLNLENWNKTRVDGYKDWLTWKLVAMIEEIDRRSVEDINLLSRSKKKII